MSIDVVSEHLINVTMFIVPKMKKVHFTNLEDSDEESSETYKKMTKLIETKEIDMTMRVYIAKINGKMYMGIEFQNGKILYRKVELLKYKDLIVYKDPANVAFIPSNNKMTLYSTERCFTCHGLFKKIYRCFDCFPKFDESETKKKQKYDFCKACYKRRDHVNHRVIAITLDSDVFERYPELDDL